MRNASFRCYNPISKGYRLYDMKTNKVIVNRDVLFNEKAKWHWEEGNVKYDGGSTIDLK